MGQLFSADRCPELRIGKDNSPDVLDDDALERLLRDRPSLKCLVIDWRPDGGKLNVDIVSRHCPNLVELDLTRFRLDPWSLEQLCKACPKLEEVTLPRKCDDACVEVLLRNLLELRSLDISHSKVTGEFFKTRNLSIQKLSLEFCKHLKLETNVQSHHSAENIPKTSLWESFRELGLSGSNVPGVKIAQILKYFPQLERLRLIGTSFTSVPPGSPQRDLAVAHLRALLASGQVEQDQCSQDQCQVPLRLRELDVSFVRGLASSDLVAILHRSTQLEIFRTIGVEPAELDLTKCLNQLSRCTELNELHLSRFGSMGKVPKALLMQSSSLDAEHARERDFSSRVIQSSALTSLLSSCHKLEELALRGCHITDSSSLRVLVQCPRLRLLDLSCVTTPKVENSTRDGKSYQSVNAADLAQGLSGCPQLEKLFVAGLQAPLEECVPPKGLPELTHLDASRSGLTNNSLRRLPGLFPKLHTLDISWCESVSEDALMSYLPQLKHLRSLNVSDVPGMTKAVEEKLKKCKLEKLETGGCIPSSCKVTPE